MEVTCVDLQWLNSGKQKKKKKHFQVSGTEMDIWWGKSAEQKNHTN